MSPDFRYLFRALDDAIARFGRWSADLDRRNRQGEFGKWPWQKDYGLWPWQRRQH